MELEFKPVVAGDIDRLRPFYGMRPNKTCDSVFLDSFLWKDYYHVQCAVSEGRAALWLMEKDGRVSTAMPLCREEDLPYFSRWWIIFRRCFTSPSISPWPMRKRYST